MSSCGSNSVADASAVSLHSPSSTGICQLQQTVVAYATYFIAFVYPQKVDKTIRCVLLFISIHYSGASCRSWVMDCRLAMMRFRPLFY